MAEKAKWIWVTMVTHEGQLRQDHWLSDNAVEVMGRASAKYKGAVITFISPLVQVEDEKRVRFFKDGTVASW